MLREIYYVFLFHCPIRLFCLDGFLRKPVKAEKWKDTCHLLQKKYFSFQVVIIIIIIIMNSYLHNFFIKHRETKKFFEKSKWLIHILDTCNILKYFSILFFLMITNSREKNIFKVPFSSSSRTKKYKFLKSN